MLLSSNFKQNLNVAWLYCLVLCSNSACRLNCCMQFPFLILLSDTWMIKHEYLRSRAYLRLSLSSPFPPSVTFSQILPLSRYSCLYLGSLHPRNFCNSFTVSSVLEAAASILYRGSVLRLIFKGGLYLRAASITTLLKLREIRTKKCTFSSKIDVFSSKVA